MSLSHSEEKLTIISWTAAKAAGLKQYFTGYPCKHGHVAVRDVSDRSCYACKLIKAAKWKHLNPEKHAEANVKWAKNNPDKVALCVRRRKARDPKRHWVHTVWSNAKSRSMKNGIPFNITKQYVYDLCGDKCPILGITFDFVGSGRMRRESPSLDKIHPELGYVEGNIAIISMKANGIKQDATWQDIQKVADWLKTKETNA